MKESTILERFVEAYPRPGLGVAYGYMLILHGTTIARSFGENSVFIQYIPKTNPEYAEEIKAISWMLSGFLAFENDQTVMTVSKPEFGKWYWLNGDNAGEEIRW